MEWASLGLQALVAIILGAILASLMKLRERLIKLETLFGPIQERNLRHSDQIREIDHKFNDAITKLEKDMLIAQAVMRRLDRQAEAGL